MRNNSSISPKKILRVASDEILREGEKGGISGVYAPRTANPA